MDHRTIANLAAEGEARFDRAYDEQTPSHVLLPNGSLVASFHRGFLGTVTREALRQWADHLGIHQPAA